MKKTFVVLEFLSHTKTQNGFISVRHREEEEGSDARPAEEAKIRIMTNSSSESCITLPLPLRLVTWERQSDYDTQSIFKHSDPRTRNPTPTAVSDKSQDAGVQRERS